MLKIDASCSALSLILHRFMQLYLSVYSESGNPFRKHKSSLINKVAKQLEIFALALEGQAQVESNEALKSVKLKLSK